MVRIKFLVFILLILSSCKTISQYDYKNEPKYIRLAYKIMKNTATELEKKKNIRLVGIGGAMMYEVEQLDMSYLSLEILNLREARDLIVFTVNLLLKNINTNENIKPYLSHYPFTAKDLRIFISIQNQYTPINGVSLFAGKIVYDAPGIEKTFEQIHEETYEEALKIVENANRVIRNRNIAKYL